MLSLEAKAMFGLLVTLVAWIYKQNVNRLRRLEREHAHLTEKVEGNGKALARIEAHLEHLRK